MTQFRLHYTDGSTLDIDAETPKQAREIADQRRSGKITKVKVLKEVTHFDSRQYADVNT